MTLRKSRKEQNQLSEGKRIGIRVREAIEGVVIEKIDKEEK